MDRVDDSRLQTEFEREHAKRDQRITSAQQRAWSEGLLSCLPDSLAYRIACTPQARLKEQAVLIALVDQWQSRQNP